MKSSKYDFPEGHRYYDEGWNDCLKDSPKKQPCSQDYADGWNDCKEAPEEDRKPI